ncbi:hypothetical protein VCHC59A1_3682, partial [Vibrio cholerae HC-59A1]
ISFADDCGGRNFHNVHLDSGRCEANFFPNYLASDLRDLNIFLESDVSLPVTTLQQLREQRMTIIEKLEFCLSSLPNAIQVLSLETN